MEKITDDHNLKAWKKMKDETIRMKQYLGQEHSGLTECLMQRSFGRRKSCISKNKMK